MTKIEHTPWIGDEFARGIDGQRTAIVGYSHWIESGEDFPSFTLDRINDMMSGASRLAFFASIRNAFGEWDHRTFWPKVMFFNLMPSGDFTSTGVARGPERFAAGTPEATELARARFDRLVETHKPEKVFVFTTKGFNDLSPLVEERGDRSLPLLPGTDIRWGRHASPPHPAVIGLRHTQGASREELRRGVVGGLALPR